MAGKQQAQRQIKRISQPCTVCGMPSAGVRCGVIACDACKKFFIRNRDHLPDLVCIFGRGDCFDAGIQASLLMNAAIRRKHCPRCRLIKCFTVGMRVGQQANANKDNNKRHRQAAANSENSSPASCSETDSISQDSNSDTLFVDLLAAKAAFRQKTISSTTSQPISLAAGALLRKAPIRFECSDAELTLKCVTSAATELCAFQSMPWTIQQRNFPNDFSLWHHAMENFNFILSAGVEFVKLLPGFGTMPVDDRCRLFSRALVPHLVAQVTLPNHKSYRLFGMPAATKQLFLRFFPVFKPLESIIDEIAEYMEMWNPSFPEFSLLQAMIFFQSPHQTMQAARISQLKLKLMQSFDWYVAQTPDAKLKRHYLTVILRLFEQFEEDYYGVITNLSNNRPDLVHLNKLFADMYNLPGGECQVQYNFLQLPPLEQCLASPGISYCDSENIYVAEN